MRLIAEVCADNRRVAVVALGQHDPVLDPTLLRNLWRIPQFGLAVGRWPVAIENHTQSTPSSSVDKIVEEPQSGQPRQVRIDSKVEVDVVGCRVQELVAERQTEGVEARGNDLVEHVVDVASLQ